ncbi:hypothetical protein OAL14_08985, partial [Gammaproteobacteria bacterium]|nr:hypothetical protein [Gammaproteobacteria bacterium]
NKECARLSLANSASLSRPISGKHILKLTFVVFDSLVFNKKANALNFLATRKANPGLNLLIVLVNFLKAHSINMRNKKQFSFTWQYYTLNEFQAELKCFGLAVN